MSDSCKEHGSIWRQLLITFLVTLRKVFDCCVDFIFAKVYESMELKRLPPVKDTLLLESASALAQRIRKKQVTSEQLVHLFIDRIEEVNSIINAVVDKRYDKAKAEAKAADDLVRSGEMSEENLKKKKPLLGVPFTSKESTAAKGLKFSFGMLRRRNVVAEEDALMIKGLKDSGAILLGVTNVPELNLWQETFNYVYGRTLNPYNVRRIVGGSSGGEASIVSSCGSPFGLGTDIGGSCRIPAYCCGVYGHKLTGGVISTKGMTFRDGTEKQTIVSAGPISKFAIDLAPISRAIAMPDQLPLLKLDTEVDAKSLKYYYVENPGDSRVSPISNEISDAMSKLMSSIGAHCGPPNPAQKVRFQGFKYSYTLWRYWMSREEHDFAFDIKNKEGRACVFTEFPKKILGQSEHTLAAILKLADMKLPMPSSRWCEEQTEKLLKEVVEKLGEDGVLLFPSYPTTAPYHNVPYLRPYNFAYWAIFNVLKLPATQVPIGVAKDGLPIGIQVVAAPYQDKLCFAVAELIEKLSGGWVPPFPAE